MSLYIICFSLHFPLTYLLLLPQNELVSDTVLFFLLNKAEDLMTKDIENTEGNRCLLHLGLYW